MPTMEYILNRRKIKKNYNFSKFCKDQIFNHTQNKDIKKQFDIKEDNRRTSYNL